MTPALLAPTILPADAMGSLVAVVIPSLDQAAEIGRRRH